MSLPLPHDNWNDCRAVLAASDYLPPRPSATPLNPKYGPDETVPGLECSYGTFAYAYSRIPEDNVSQRSRRAGCHNPVECPHERHHCDICGGDYCSVHADGSAHDCHCVILPG